MPSLIWFELGSLVLLALALRAFSKARKKFSNKEKKKSGSKYYRYR